jgi:heme/copper-type cytochrome/quinol oxidase subunit 3
MYADGISIDSDLFTSAFYTLTGFHGVHVAVGLLALGIVAALAFAGDVRKERHTAFEAVALYWHFVDVVWVVIFTIVYLPSLR